MIKQSSSLSSPSLSHLVIGSSFVSFLVPLLIGCENTNYTISYCIRTVTKHYGQPQAHPINSIQFHTRGSPISFCSLSVLTDFIFYTVYHLGFRSGWNQLTQVKHCLSRLPLQIYTAHKSQFKQSALWSLKTEDSLSRSQLRQRRDVQATVTRQGTEVEDKDMSSVQQQTDCELQMQFKLCLWPLTPFS